MGQESALERLLTSALAGPYVKQAVWRSLLSHSEGARRGFTHALELLVVHDVEVWGERRVELGSREQQRAHKAHVLRMHKRISLFLHSSLTPLMIARALRPL